MRHLQLFEQFINEAEKDKAWDKLNNIADDVYGEFGFASLGEYEMAKHIDLKKADKLASKIYGEFGFATLSEEEMEELIKKNPKLVKESVINEEKAKGDRGPLKGKGVETGIKNKSKESGVPVALLRLVMRRGMDAWNSSHHPGMTQEGWGYARVNAFLEKGKGTWGGADKDIAKEVRDGGHDKKLPFKSKED
jgi:hypothetical protein